MPAATDGPQGDPSADDEERGGPQEPTVHREYLHVEELAMDPSAFSEAAREVVKGDAQTGPATLCPLPADGRMLRIAITGSVVVHAAAGRPVVVRFVAHK